MEAIDLVVGAIFGICVIYLFLKSGKFMREADKDIERIYRQWMREQKKRSIEDLLNNHHEEM